jgi:PAS domain S-box-containing protein
MEPFTELPQESSEEIYENAPCGYISTLPTGVIVRVNQTLLSWMGATRQELLAGRRFQDLLSIGSKVVHETYYVPLLRTQGFVNEVAFDLATRQGRALPVLASTVVKKDAEGRPLLYRTTLFNISERKQLERELRLARKKAEEAAKAKADFLSMMSHEIRTPMNAVVGLANLLTQTELSPQQEKYLHLLQTSSENLLGLLNDILDFSKIEAGKVSLEQRNLDVRELLDGVCCGLGVKAEQKGLFVRMDIDEAVPACVVGDPVKLRQVLTNLLSNAIKFTERGGVTVEVRVREYTPEAVGLDFGVRDTGIGIPQERLAQVFEEFTQASYDISQRYGGTGLGLAICQKLLELHGSRMEVESTPGVGSTFRFHLRMRHGQEVAASASPAPALPAIHRLEGVKLLVAEDNDLNVFVLSQFLRKWGADFDVVGDGQQALERIQAEHYDLVLMDLQMPRMSGYEATRAVRRLPEERFQRLPILALTASARMSHEERAELVGFSDLLGKPFKPEELFTKIASHCARPLAARSAARCREEPRDVQEPAPAPPRLGLEKFWALAEGDPHAMLELGTLAVENAVKGKLDFQEAIDAADAEAFEFHAHKLKMILELVRNPALRAALQEARQLLAAGGGDATRRHAVILAIHRELDAVIHALQDEMRQVSAGLASPEASHTPVQDTAARS